MKYWLFIGLLPLSFLQSFSQELAEKWETYMRMYGKKPGSVMVNLALKERAPLLNYRYLLITGVRLQDCSPEGFPPQQELKTLYKISDEIQELVDKKKKNIPAGSLTTNCERTDFFYVNDTVLLRKYLVDFYQSNYPQYRPIIVMKDDRNWDAYQKTLFPDEEAMETLHNQKMVIRLLEAGDALDQKRSITHWLYFKTEQDRNQFISSLADQEFIIDAATEADPSKPLPYRLYISRNDYADLIRISQLTLMLRKEAKRHTGVYEGWETVVIKK